jgi:microcompartment protein CcmL/EutN
MISLGLIELSSIARGIEAGDAMLKAADVRLLRSATVCPGKYIVIVTGEVAAVAASMAAGKACAAAFYVDDLVIANLDEQVAAALSGCTVPPAAAALGVMEFFSIAASVVAADAAVKAADVSLLEVRLGLGIGGKSFVTLTGSVASVQAAVSAGAKGAAEKGMVVCTSVIPSPSAEIFRAML